MCDFRPPAPCTDQPIDRFQPTGGLNIAIVDGQFAEEGVCLVGLLHLP